MAAKGDKQGVKINTTLYQKVWGKKPRGYGYWFVRIGNHKEVFTGTYSDVIKSAKAVARSVGEMELVILP